MDKKLNLLYFSATNTTAKVVKAVASGMGAESKEYNITLPANREKEIVFGCDDLVIVGVPVYAGRVPVFLTDYFAKVKGNNTLAIFIVVYGNRDYDDALLELKDIFEENGFIAIAGGTFIGEHSYTAKVATNRPDNNDLKIAKEFGVDIIEKLKNTEDTIKSSKIDIKGKFPYKELKSMPPMGPETNDSCIDCGVCAKYCPMGAINFNNFKEVDTTKCIKCFSCIKRCPKDAKTINHEIIKNFTKMLIDNFSEVRSEPELFI